MSLGFFCVFCEKQIPSKFLWIILAGRPGEFTHHSKGPEGADVISLILCDSVLCLAALLAHHSVVSTAQNHIYALLVHCTTTTVSSQPEWATNKTALFPTVLVPTSGLLTHTWWHIQLLRHIFCTKQIRCCPLRDKQDYGKVHVVFFLFVFFYTKQSWKELKAVGGCGGKWNRRWNSPKLVRHQILLC